MTKGAFMHDLNAYRALDAKRQKPAMQPPGGYWYEIVVILIFLLVVVSACSEILGGK